MAASHRRVLEVTRFLIPPQRMADEGPALKAALRQWLERLRQSPAKVAVQALFTARRPPAGDPGPGTVATFATAICEFDSPSHARAAAEVARASSHVAMALAAPALRRVPRVERALFTEVVALPPGGLHVGSAYELRAHAFEDAVAREAYLAWARAHAATAEGTAGGRVVGFLARHADAPCASGVTSGEALSLGRGLEEATVADAMWIIEWPSVLKAAAGLRQVLPAIEEGRVDQSLCDGCTIGHAISSKPGTAYDDRRFHQPQRGRPVPVDSNWGDEAR